MTLLELAERCEHAPGPNFRLEQEIWAAAVAVPSANLTALGNIKPPAYTASLDAAMTLVPEGCDWRVGQGRVSAWAAVHKDFIPTWRTDPIATTPALALCAAALRARAQTPPENGNHG